ncbi:MAG: leucine-rich repeat protein [Clostridia bacterium]|nr:leucine-rich repeat protein [Clostridia bacterium]
MPTGDLQDYLIDNLTSITIGESITSIPKWGFYGTAATSVSLPSTLTSVDEESFLDSRWLMNLCEERIWIR